MNAPLFSAVDIATIMQRPGDPLLLPTPDQQRVIEHPLGDAVLVVAGAGSGKTETIANRVVWLVANRCVSPSEVLGLTFTKKAAGELAERLREKLFSFVKRAQEPNFGGILNADQHAQIASLDRALSEALDLPEVSTYNAFAVAVSQEFGTSPAAAGVLIDDATAWGIARQIVVESEHPGLAELSASIDTMTEHVLRLDRTASEHLVSLDRVVQETERFLAIERLPRDQRAIDQGVQGTPYADVRKVVASVAVTSVAAQIAETYAETKAQGGFLEYSDQVALALQTVEGSPEAVATLKRRHRVILLDEVQDTSVAQTRLLSAIYRGHSVMGVGDPHQSIYGWRGASTESLSGFHAAFERTGKPNRPVLSLTTSWRNASSILEAANVIAGPLRADSTIDVSTLKPRPGAPRGSVDAIYTETIREETRCVAKWVRDQRETHLESHGEAPTVALLFRSRATMQRYGRALSDAGVPNRIVGVGGLLNVPEVVDIVATLHALANPDAGNHLVRLLTGPKFAVGVPDIRALKDLAGWLAKRDHTHRIIDSASLANSGPLERERNHVALLDALDVLIRLPDDHRALQAFTETGRARVREVGHMLQRLRRHMHSPVPDLIGQVVLELGLDIELASHERWNDETTANAHSNIHAFTEEVRQFLQVSDQQRLSAVLRWLERSERQDEMAAYVPPPSPDTVQLTTVHSAKGLEWDIVVIPNLSTGAFPTSPKSTSGWMQSGVLPDRLRGDAATRPELRWDLAATQQEFVARLKQYRNDHRESHEEEERRLTYVAITRARERLLLTGSFWRGNQKPALPSSPLLELAEATLIPVPPTSSESDSSPDDEPQDRLIWPFDPLGARRGTVERAAHAVNAARNALSADDELDEISQLLLAQAHQESKLATHAITDWNRVNASAFHEFVADPDAQVNQLVRPMPQRPYGRTRLGNLFHDWVEMRSTTPRGTVIELELEGLEPSSTGQITAEDRIALDELIEVFERSRWANEKPLLVEEELTIPFAGRRVVCKLDAVYERDGRVEIVDWKTGRMPADEDETQQRFLQLDLYRVAYSLTYDVPLDMIDVTLFYVRDNHTITSREARTLDALETIWQNALTRVSAAGHPQEHAQDR